MRHLQIVTFLFALLLSQTVWANIDARVFSDEEKLETYQGLIRELRCPKCQNQDIADSNAPIARDMRQNVQALVEQGKAHDEIVDFMIERFGEFVTYKPRVKPETYLLWYGPWVLVALGFVIVLLIVRAKRSDTNNAEHQDGIAGTDLSGPDMEKVNALLNKYDADPSEDDRRNV